MNKSVPLALFHEAYNLNNDKASCVIIRDDHMDFAFEDPYYGEAFFAIAKAFQHNIFGDKSPIMWRDKDKTIITVYS